MITARGGRAPAPGSGGGVSTGTGVACACLAAGRVGGRRTRHEHPGDHPRVRRERQPQVRRGAGDGARGIQLLLAAEHAGGGEGEHVPHHPSPGRRQRGAQQAPGRAAPEAVRLRHLAPDDREGPQPEGVRGLQESVADTPEGAAGAGAVGGGLEGPPEEEGGGGAGEGEVEVARVAEPGWVRVGRVGFRGLEGRRPGGGVGRVGREVWRARQNAGPRARRKSRMVPPVRWMGCGPRPGGERVRRVWRGKPLARRRALQGDGR